MRSLCHLILTAGFLTVTTGPMASGDPPPAPPAEQRDPQDAFRKACDHLVALEAKNDLLKGVSEIKPVVEQDDKKGLKTAQFVFERNAMPPGKGPAKPKDDGKPFVYVSVQVWAGRSRQQPADLHEFEWRGQTYQMWVRVFSSDAELVKAVRKAVAEPLVNHRHPSRNQPVMRSKATRNVRPLHLFEGWVSLLVFS